MKTKIYKINFFGISHKQTVMLYPTPSMDHLKQYAHEEICVTNILNSKYVQIGQILPIKLLKNKN